jgi:nicotinamide riboside transporter PnuC
MSFLTLTLEQTQWIGCTTGVLGSALLAANRSRVSGWGFVAYLISNVFWIAFAAENHAPGLLTQQVVFTLTSLIGIWRWLIAPAQDSLQERIPAHD